MKYICKIPFQDDMGSIMPFVVTSTPFESAAQNALWEYNSMRRHDGLKEKTNLPNGTKLEKAF